MTEKTDKIHETYKPLNEKKRVNQMAQKKLHLKGNLYYLDIKKTYRAVAMMQHTWEACLGVAFALCDSRFTCEEFIILKSTPSWPKSWKDLRGLYNIRQIENQIFRPHRKGGKL